MRLSIKSLKNRSDKELIKRFRKSGNSDYLGELYLRYSHLVFFVCHKYLDSTQDAEDATMEIFDSLFGLVRKWEIVNFKSWVGTIAKNYCLMKLRHQKGSVTESLDEEIGETSHWQTDVSENQKPEKRELVLSHLDDAISRLDESQRRCIDLFYYQGKSLKEIMNIMNCNWDQVRSHMQNAKRNIQISLVRKAGNELIKTALGIDS